MQSLDGDGSAADADHRALRTDGLDVDIDPDDGIGAESGGLLLGETLSFQAYRAVGLVVPGFFTPALSP